MDMSHIAYDRMEFGTQTRDDTWWYNEHTDTWVRLGWIVRGLSSWTAMYKSPDDGMIIPLGIARTRRDATQLLLDRYHLDVMAGDVPVAESADG